MAVNGQLPVVAAITPVELSNSYIVLLSNATLTSGEGSRTVTGIQSPNVYIIWDIITTAGSSFDIEIYETDPQNPTYRLTGGQSASTSIDSLSSGILALSGISSNCVNISWNVTGNWSGVYLTLTNSLPSSSGGGGGGNVNLTQISSNSVISGGVSGSLGVGGLGSAGSPSGGVLSVQGVSGGELVPISGTITANAGSGTFTVNGTVTANQGSPPWSIELAAPTTTQLSGEVVNFSTSGNNTVISGVSAQTIRVFRLFMVFGGTTNITFYDGSNVLTGAIPMQSGGSIVLDFQSDPWFVTSVSNSFIANLSSGVQVSGRVYYTQS